MPDDVIYCSRCGSPHMGWSAEKGRHVCPQCSWEYIPPEKAQTSAPDPFPDMPVDGIYSTDTLEGIEHDLAMYYADINQGRDLHGDDPEMLLRSYNYLKGGKVVSASGETSD